MVEIFPAVEKCIVMRNVFLLLSVVLICCSGTAEGSVRVDNKHFSVENAVKNCKEVKLGRYAREIEYIPLETTPESVMGYVPRFDFDGKYYYVQTQEESVLVFDTSGKFVRTVDRKGRGPKEYLSIQGLSVEHDLNSDFCIFDDFKILSCYVENSNVRVIRPDIQGGSTIRYGAYLEKGNYAFTAAIMVDKLKYLQKVFVVDTMSKVVFSYELSEEGSYCMKGAFLGDMDIVCPDLVYSFNGALRVFNGMGDRLTLFSTDFKELSNYIFDFGKYKRDVITKDGGDRLRFDVNFNSVKECASFIRISLLGNKYSLSGIYSRGSDSEFKKGVMILDKVSNELYTMPYNYEFKAHGFVNDIDGGAPFDPQHCIGNKMYQIIAADKFIEYATKSNSPKMKEIAATLTEESNPVLVVATLK